jgi:hypothetical protein
MLGMNFNFMQKGRTAHAVLQSLDKERAESLYLSFAGV